MRINFLDHTVFSAKSFIQICALSTLITFTPGCGVETDNDDLGVPEDIVETTNQGLNAYKPLGPIPDKTLSDLENGEVREPYIDDSLGYNVIRTDLGTLLRGVSLSTDGGDPYDANNLLTKEDIT